jgi:hypothetical protein
VIAADLLFERTMTAAALLCERTMTDAVQS